MSRLWPRRLTVRVAIALVAASMLTLLAATLTLVPPLEHRIERDRVSDLRRLASTARPALRGLTRAQLVPGSEDLREIVGRLQRRTGGRIGVFDARGVDLVAIRIGRRDPTLRLLRRGLAQRPASGTATSGGIVGDDVLVRAPVRIHGRPYTIVLATPLSDVHAAARSVRRTLPVAALVGLAVAVLLAAGLSTGLLGRLRRLQGDARALGDRGLGHRVETSGGDEVAEVARALEAMRLRLVEADAGRQAFIATASHELRTPLAALQATLELLREQLSRAGEVEYDPVAAQARADAALRNTHRLTHLATDLLDLSRLDGEAPLRIEPVEMGEVAGLVASEAIPRLAAEDRRLIVAGGDDAVHAMADADAAVRILRILLDNARAHGAGDVELSLRRDGEWVFAWVRDAGGPLPAAEAEPLFGRFARGQGAAARPSGFGLGLPIGRGLARAMGGDLVAVDVDDGTCFQLLLRAWLGSPAAEGYAATSSEIRSGVSGNARAAKVSTS